MIRKFLNIILCSLTTIAISSAQQEDYSAVDLVNLRNDYLTKGNFGEYLNSSLKLGQLYIDEGKLDSSVVVLRKAVQLNYSESSLDSLLADCHHTLGIAYYFNGYDSDAINHWEQAIESRTNFLAPNHILIVKGLRNIGNAYFELKNYEKAEEHLSISDSLNNSRSVPDPIKEAQLNAELGAVNFKLNDLNKAFRHLTIAEELYLKYFQDEPWELSLLYENWALYYNELKEGSKMLAYSSKSIELYNNIEELYNEDIIAIARGHNNSGIAHILLEDLPNAIKSYKKSISTFEKFPDAEGVLTEISSSSSNLSTALIQSEDYDQALKYIDIAIGINIALNDEIAHIKDLENKAGILLAKGDFDLALSNINKAIELINKGGNQNIFNVDKPVQVFVNRTKSKILNKLYEQNKDLNDLQQSSELVYENMQLIAEVRNEFVTEETKAFLSGEAKSVIEDGIATLIKLYQATDNPDMILKAWELSEKAKSIILLESLRSYQAKKSSFGNNKLLAKEDSIKKEIAKIESDIYNYPDSSVILNKQYLKANTQLEQIADEIKTANPKYAAATKDISEITLKESLKAIDSDIVEYFIGEESAYVFVKNGSELACYNIDSTQVIKHLIQEVRTSTVDIFSYAANKDKNFDQAVKNYTAAASSLYKALFSSIEANLTLSDDLLVIPDGALGYLPFDLLLTEATESVDFSTLPYLIKEHNISYTYSIALLDEMKGFNHTAASKDLLAIAPLFENNDEVYLYGTREVKKEQQPPLYFNEEEVETIQTIMGGDIVTGTEATEAYFMDNASNYKMLHLSTHGKANDDKGSFSYLAFTEILDSTENEFVYNYDLYNLDLNAEMVVLSACETGLGELKEGEGIISLARGFSFAGAKSIINTLWTINDYRTKEIMESFYTSLSQGERKDVALRKAKLDFIENNPSDALPFYWAAFIPVGDMSELPSGGFDFRIGTLLAIGLVLFLAIFLWSRTKRKS